MPSKRVSLREAARAVAPGAHLALTGFAITRNGVAMAHELIRAGARDLTVSQVVGGIETDLLVGAGCVRHLCYSGGSLDRFGPLHAVNRALHGSQITADEYSSLSLTLRFHAAGLGLPFMPSRAMLGSQLLDRLLASGEVRIGDDPFGSGPVVMLAPIHPDVAVVHADVADDAGNAAVSGPTWSIREVAFAARTVVVVAEEVVPTGTLPAERTLIPGSIVGAVVEVPHGAHPTAVYGHYDYDRDHLQRYVAFTREGPDALVNYLDRYVHSVRDFDDYLVKASEAA